MEGIAEADDLLAMVLDQTGLDAAGTHDPLDGDGRGRPGEAERHEREAEDCQAAAHRICSGRVCMGNGLSVPGAPGFAGKRRAVTDGLPSSTAWAAALTSSRVTAAIRSGQASRSAKVEPVASARPMTLPGWDRLSLA